MKLEFSPTDFRKELNFMKICPVGPICSTRTDRQTDLKLMVAFRNFAKAPNKLRLGEILCSREHKLAQFDHAWLSSSVVPLFLIGIFCEMLTTLMKIFFFYLI